MAAGVPCLAFRGDGVRYHNANAEVIQHGRDGFLADSDDAFRQELERLIRQPALLQAAGVHARQLVASRLRVGASTWTD